MIPDKNIVSRTMLTNRRDNLSIKENINGYLLLIETVSYIH